MASASCRILASLFSLWWIGGSIRDVCSVKSVGMTMITTYLTSLRMSSFILNIFNLFDVFYDLRT
jgi:hypothetical protein